MDVLLLAPVDWPDHEDLVDQLEAAGHLVSTDKDWATSRPCFAWSALGQGPGPWAPEVLEEAGNHPVVRAACRDLALDCDLADALVLVAPLSVDAGMTAGVFLERDKPVYVLALDRIFPALVYLWANAICRSPEEVLDLLSGLAAGREGGGVDHRRWMLP